MVITSLTINTAITRAMENTENTVDTVIPMEPDMVMVSILMMKMTIQ